MADVVVIVIGLEGAEVEFADVDRLLGVLAAALAAFEIAEKFLAQSFCPLPRIDLDDSGQWGQRLEYEKALAPYPPRRRPHHANRTELGLAPGR